MEIIPDQSTDLYGPSSTEDIAEITKPVATMELQIGQAVLRISNQTDPRLLEQTLKTYRSILMLGDISVVDDIYIVCGYTDMRKQIDGLYSDREGSVSYGSRAERYIFSVAGVVTGSKHFI